MSDLSPGAPGEDTERTAQASWALSAQSRPALLALDRASKVAGGRSGLPFRSILFENAEKAPRKEPEKAPDFFTDLNLDQLVGWITVGKDEIALKPLFYSSLDDVAEIAYRHEVMRDLEKKELLDPVNAFAQTMQLMRDELAQSAKLYYKYQKQWWFLDAVDVYSKGVRSFLRDLNSIELQSRGLWRFVRIWQTMWRRTASRPL